MTRTARGRTAGAVVGAVLAVVAVTATAQALRGTAGPAPADPAPAPPAAASAPPVGEPVPWALRLAPQQAGFRPPPPADPAEPCRAQDVSVVVEQARAEPARDGRPAHVRATVLLTNEGPRCSLPAEARGVLLDEDGDVLPLSGRAGFGGPAYEPPPPLQRGATASAPITWSSWCGDDPGRWGVRLELEGETVRGRLRGDEAPVPPCTPSSADGLYGLGRWTSLNAAGQPALDPQSALTASVTGPDSGHLGEVLPMVLRLSNPTRGPIALSPCPVFTWSVDRSGPGSFLRSSPALELNCPAAPQEVPAGGAVDFALELELTSALADGMLAPGRWWVHPAIADTAPRPITVLPSRTEQPDGPATCAWVVPPDADPRVPGLPARRAPRTVLEAVLRTNRGDLVLELDGRRAPCAVQAFVHHARGGYWDGQPCYLLSTQPTFRNVDCGTTELAPVRAGFGFAAETRTGTDYPAGTVVLTHNESTTHAGSIRILYGDAPTYADNFTVLGRVTRGLEVVEQVAAGGQRDGEWAGPRLELRIRTVELPS